MSPKENKFLKVILTCFEYSQSTYSHADCEYVIFKKLTFSHLKTIGISLFGYQGAWGVYLSNIMCSQLIQCEQTKPARKYVRK